MAASGPISSFRIILDEDQALPGPCKWVDHTPGSCARRGGDGFAFVVQNFGEQTLGQGGGGLGYGGIPNAVAVEFDTWFDSNLRDPYENHLAVLTRGRSQLRSEHGTHLGVCLDIPDLADGERHDVRVEYDPVFRAEAAMCMNRSRRRLTSSTSCTPPPSAFGMGSACSGCGSTT